MSDDSDNKTLAPTPKKIEDARKRGETATAPEMRHAIALAAMLGGLTWLGGSFARDLAQLSAALWEGAGDIRLEPTGSQQFTSALLAKVAAITVPLLACIFVGGALTAFAAGRPSWSLSRLAPKWSKVSPVAGLKRLFGTQGLLEFLKTLAKCALVLWLGWWVIRPVLAGADTMVGMDPASIGVTASAFSMTLLKWLAVLIAVIAAADFAWQRFAFTRKLRMSHQEMRDEYKDSEGDPAVKARQRQLGAQRSRQRMVAAVPTASVVVTNPTHFAVALRYEHGAMRAPIVVAKGTDRLALRIRELATEAGVPLVENKPLARALYASAEVDRPIPVEQYAAVAEVISFVLRNARPVGA